MDRTIISNELSVIIDALQPIVTTDTVVTLPNTPIKQKRQRVKNMVSIIGINGSIMRGLNKDEGKLGVKYDLTIGIKSTGDRPLDTIIELQDKIIDKMRSLGYYEGDSSIVYDTTGVPILYQYLICKVYKGGN